MGTRMRPETDKPAFRLFDKFPVNRIDWSDEGSLHVADGSADNGEAKGPFHRAHDTLQEWILSGEVVPNQHLIEIDLAQTLNVSRTTIRSVLLDLNKEGFVTLEPNRGARVRSFSPEEAREILVVRERLEGIAAGLAAENITKEILDELDQVVEEMAAVDASNDMHAHARLSRRYHSLVLEAAQNRMVARFIEQTRYPLVVRQFWNLDVQHPRPESLDQHRAILTAIRGRDSMAAEKMMRMHVSSARDALKLGVAKATEDAESD